MIDNVKEVASYFAKRAVRYQKAQTACPLARTLDLLPYVYVLEQFVSRQQQPLDSLQIFDAFGGAGFLSRAFAHTDISFTIGDCTDAYAKDQHHHHEWLLTDDYFDAISRDREGSYDLVFAHGGLHHVYVKNGGAVDLNASRNLQATCLTHLCRLLRPGGLLVLGDIPESDTTRACGGAETLRAKDQRLVDDLLGSSRRQFLQSSIPQFASNVSLSEMCEELRANVRDSTHCGSLRDFFDGFVAVMTPYGHEACFLNFEQLCQSVAAVGMVPAHTVKYPGAWIFGGEQEAIWFFREMFAFGDGAPPFQVSPQDLPVRAAITDILGERRLQNCLAVNWGVTYVVLRKG